MELNKQDSFAGWPKLIFWAGMLVFTFHACTHMVAAGDTWVALACGKHFVNHGVDTVDPFSANSHKAGPSDEQLEKFPEWSRGIIKKIHPTGWINQNWLTHSMFYWLSSTFGSEGEYNYNVMVYWKFAVNIIAAFCIYYFARLLGVSVPGSATSAAVAMLVARTFIDIRPAVHGNVMVCAFLLTLALATYKNIKYIWLVVPITVLWSNLHGGYIYVFIMLVPFVGLNLLTCLSKEKFTSIRLRGIYHTIAAGFTAFITMIIFNPFHLTNLTHTFEISLSKHAESWRRVNEWRPAFERDNPVGEEEAFIVLFIIGWLALAVWVVARFFKPRIESKRRARQGADLIKGNYEWPKIDLAMLAVAALTVYMAIKSRRFIPIAAYAACPVIAMFFEHAVSMIRARLNFNKSNDLSLPELPKTLRTSVIAAGAIAAVVFGAAWGAKYKRIYLDPWALDDLRDSVFMRMTASNLKPIDACTFIRDNNISGNMFNYWTEGGAIAFGQNPDPKTGKTPLQLFMDGRAQAAYDHDKYLLWQLIYAGNSQTALKARMAGRRATNKELREIAESIDQELSSRDIWVFMAPNSEFVQPKNWTMANYLPLTLPAHPDWQCVYIDSFQQMYVDTSTKKGEKLYSDMMEGKAEFPNEFAMNLTLGKNYLRLLDTEMSRKGFEHAKKAFEIDNCFAPMQQLINEVAMRHVHLKKEANDFIEKYLIDFIANRETLKSGKGYLKKLDAAWGAASHLSNVYAKSNPQLAKKYEQLNKELVVERQTISEKIRW